MNRRDFFTGVVAATVAASAGFALTPQQRRYVANYRRAYSINSDEHIHRLDVRADGNVYYCDARTPYEHLKASDVEIMLKMIEQYLGENVTVALA